MKNRSSNYYCIKFSRVLNFQWKLVAWFFLNFCLAAGLGSPSQYGGNVRRCTHRTWVTVLPITIAH
jgi:hypothetical protein